MGVGVGVAVPDGVGVGVAAPVGVGVGDSVSDGVGVGDPGRAPIGVGVADGRALGPTLGLGVEVGIAPGATPCEAGVLVAVGDWSPGRPPVLAVAPDNGPPALVPLALAPKVNQSRGAGSQLRPAPTKGSQVNREPVSQISVPGPRPSTKKRSRTAIRRASSADVTRSRRVFQNLLPGSPLSRIVSVATSISLRNDGDLRPYLRR